MYIETLYQQFGEVFEALYIRDRVEKYIEEEIFENDDVGTTLDK